MYNSLADKGSFKNNIIKFLVYGSVVYLTSEFLRWSAIDETLGRKFSEDSAVEYLQSLALLFCSIIYLWTCRIMQSIKPLSIGLFGFHFASFIREQDAFLDEYLFDGAWQTFAFGVLIFAIAKIALNWKLFLTNVSTYTHSTAYGILLSGILTTYIFARLYGRKIFWAAVMEDQYMRDVKNVSEESLELYGYILLMIASFEYLLFIRSLSGKRLSGLNHNKNLENISN
ncbi:MAG: hypothetical protein ABWZ79_00465 [Pedobacter agri]